MPNRVPLPPLVGHMSTDRLPHRMIPCVQDDDEFEEFEQQEWTGASEDAHDPDMWQDGWEDDEDAAPLIALFRAELAKTPAQ